MSGNLTVLDMSGQVVLITGAAGSIGAAHARLLAARGASLVVNDLNVDVAGQPDGEDRLAALAHDLRAAGAAVLESRHDVSDPAQARVLVADAVAEYGALHAIVNNAGNARSQPVARLVSADMLATLTTHVLGTANVVAAAWEILCGQHQGRVLNTTSSVGLFGQARSSAYAASKGAIVGLTRTWAIEGTEHGIRVNAVAPLARSRMAANVFGALTAKLDPDLVAAGCLPLVHPSCSVSGEIFSIGGGRVGRLTLGATSGIFDAALTPEVALRRLGEVLQSQAEEYPVDAMAEIDLLRREYADLAEITMSYLAPGHRQTTSARQDQTRPER